MAEDFPYRFDVTASPGELQERFASLGPSEGSGAIATVAGRVMLRREMGKLTFLTLTGWTGSLQLFAGAQWTERFGELNKLSLGDWVGATGEVVRTKTGEL
jgi:lysyl-tRNA synthetase class 2